MTEPYWSNKCIEDKRTWEEILQDAYIMAYKVWEEEDRQEKRCEKGLRLLLEKEIDEE